MLRKLDDFLYKLADLYLKFLLEWLGVTKKQACLFHLFMYGNIRILCDIHAHAYALLFFGGLLILYFLTVIIIGMYFARMYPLDVLIAIFLFIVFIPVLIKWHDFWDMLDGLGGLLYVCLLYVMMSNGDGIRGRKAKMAWNKIKELFGTAWIPEPVKIPS